MCISAVHPDGQQKQIYIACPGAMIGEEACILSQPHMTMATTIVQSELYAIPSKEVQALFHSEQKTADPHAAIRGQKEPDAHFSDRHDVLRQCGTAHCKDAPVPVRCLWPPQADGILIALRFTCADLAGIVGTSRVTANNVLLDFSSAGILSKQNGHYMIHDWKTLQAITARSQ